MAVMTLIQFRNLLKDTMNYSKVVNIKSGRKIVRVDFYVNEKNIQPWYDLQEYWTENGYRFEYDRKLSPEHTFFRVKVQLMSKA